MSIPLNGLLFVLILISQCFGQSPSMTISHAGLSPSNTLTVEPGEEITFIYGGGGPHPMTSGHGSTPSPVFFPTVTVTTSNPQETFSLQEPGTYLFHCGTNPGNSSNWGTIIVEATSDLEAPESHPADFILLEAWPNPFNPVTTLYYTIARAGDTRLAVYNLQGERIRTLFSGTLSSGTHSFKWDGRTDNGLSLGSGVYILEAETGDQSIARTVTLQK